MACIIIVKNKKSGNEYAYQSVSYRDPITKKPRNKRTYLGRVDPVSGKIIPVQKQGRKNFTKSNQEKNKNINDDVKTNHKDTASEEDYKKRISSLETNIEQLNIELCKFKKAVEHILNEANNVLK